METLTNPRVTEVLNAHRDELDWLLYEISQVTDQTVTYHTNVGKIIIKPWMSL